MTELHCQPEHRTASGDELEEALISARIALAERREAAQQRPQVQKIRELKEHITHMALETSENRSRMEFLIGQIEQARQMLTHSTEYEMLKIKADVKRQVLYESMRQLEELQQEYNLLTAPQITVISQ